MVKLLLLITVQQIKKKEIAQKLTDKVYDFKWMNNFVEARNFAASKVSGTWIIAVDADECIDINNFVAAMEEIKSYKDKISIFLVEIMSFVGDNGEEITVNTMARLYKMMGVFIFMVECLVKLKCYEEALILCVIQNRCGQIR